MTGPRINRDENPVMNFTSCAFCRIIRNEEPADIVDETVMFLAIRPLNPVIEGHLLVLPRKHVRDAGDNPDITGLAFRFAAVIAGNYMPPAYNLISSTGGAATQTVPHLHIHLVPRTEGDGLALPWTGQHKEVTA